MSLQSEREKSLDSHHHLRVTHAVAQNLAKLMAYKDEYEVARLYADPAFTVKLRAQFEGEPGKDYQLHFHLAPPLFSRKDDKGHLIKKKYGPWTMPLFKVLAKMKGLRATPLDIFGKTQERRQERQLVLEYLAFTQELASTLNQDNMALALEIAKLPEDIRGFGHIKEKNLQIALQRRHKLLANYRRNISLERTA